MSDSSPAADALVTFRVPRSLKNDWVRRSQRAGLKLTDWLIAQIASASDCVPLSGLDVALPPLSFSPSSSLSPGLSVAQLRQLAGLTQEGLAASVGVSKSAVEKWESGSAAPSQATIELLLLLAGRHPEFLLVERS